MGKVSGGGNVNLALLQKIETLENRITQIEAGNEKALQYIDNGPWGFNSSVELTSNDDLNNCTDFDTLYSWGGEERPINSPMDRCGMYNVKSPWGIMQIVIKHNQPVLYIRLLFVDTFSSWKEI